MARLEAVAKALYYPTPDSVAKMLGRYMYCERPYHGRKVFRALDTCCGEGRALQTLAKEIDGGKWSTYGVEIDAERAREASTRLLYTLHGPAEQALLAQGGWDLVFCNPPYDDDGAGGRLEIAFLTQACNVLADNGTLVYIVPEHIVQREDFRAIAAAHLTAMRVLRFPPSEYERFKQVVLIARRTRSEWSRGDGAYTMGELTPQSTYQWRVNMCPNTPTGSLAFAMPDVTVPPPGPRDGVYGTVAWDVLMCAHDREFAQPLLRPRLGHRAMLLAAGALDGCQIGQHLVRGRAVKREVIRTTDEEEIRTERIATEFASLDLTTGDLETWDTDDEARTAAWLREHADAVGEAVERTHRPLYDGDTSWADAVIDQLHPPGALPGHTVPEFLPLQREAACAAVYRWRRHKSVLLSGTMGVGKTMVAILAEMVALAPKTVVVCPTHLVSKWCKEVDKVLGRKGSAMRGKRASDVDAFFSSHVARFLVVSKETAKLGTKWRPTAGRRRLRIQTYDGAETKLSAQCPACGSLAPLGPAKSWTPAKTLEETKDRIKCEHCAEPLWQFGALSAKGTKRWPLARLISRYARQYNLVLDEAHQFSKAETDQSKAVQRLCSGAVKILAMTGTVYGGRASSIFHLLYKIEPSFRETYAYTDVARFVEHHGLFERSIKEETRRTSYYGYRKGKAKERVREIPGMSPAMIPMILPYTIFLNIKDLREDLPPYEESVELVDHDPDVLAATQAMERDAKFALREYPEAAGSYLMACLGYPDQPNREERVIAIERDDDGEEVGEVLLASAPAIDLPELPKDTRVAEIALREAAEGRKVLVYCTQTGKRDPRQRLAKVLRDRGLRVSILEASVAPDKRIDWVAREEKRGFDVMITNGRLVETGVDLMWATTIVQYGVEYSVNSLRQSIRRSWRLGQKHPVRVIFMAYAGTLQASAMDLVAQKMAAAELVDGDDLGGLAQSSGGGNLLVDLAREVLG